MARLDGGWFVGLEIRAQPGCAVPVARVRQGTRGVAALGNVPRLSTRAVAAVADLLFGQTGGVRTAQADAAGTVTDADIRIIGNGNRSTGMTGMAPFTSVTG